MKTRRFLSVFFLFALLCSLLLTPSALAEEGKSVEDPAVAAKAALLVDQKTGTVLYGRNEHQELYPASLTKIMTALLVLEAVDSGKLSLNQEITASASALSTLSADGSSAGIKAGEVMTVRQLLDCMLIVSANEACNILAEAVSGSVDAFVDAMNQRAQALGCANTHFVNATGLHDSQHYTSAWDLYLITKEALTHSDFLTICDTADIVLPATNLSDQRHLYTTNYLLSNWRAIGYRYSDAHGIKTGSTTEAGHCLVSSATQGSLSFISVVLGAEAVKLETGKTQVQSFSETTRLFKWGFDNFSYKTILTPTEMLASMPVTLSKEAGSVALHSTEDTVVLLPNTLKAEDLTRTIRFSAKSVAAPVSEGQKLAEVELSYGDTVYATVPLAALNDVTASPSLVRQQLLREFFQRTSVRILLVVLAILVVFLLGWKLTVGRRRYRYGKNVRQTGSSYRGRRKRF